MIISYRTLEQIKTAFLNAPIESGGIIGSTGKTVDTFYLDEDNHNYDCYIPDTAKLNAKIKDWTENGISFAGLIHSHANGCRQLSNADKQYAIEIFKAAKRAVYFPIVTVCNDDVILTSYLIKDFKLIKDKITVTEN